jgi:hypothetical protein
MILEDCYPLPPPITMVGIEPGLVLEFDATPPAPALQGRHREMDHLKNFVAEQLTVTTGYKPPASQMFDRYKKWCSAHGERTADGLRLSRRIFRNPSI